MAHRRRRNKSTNVRTLVARGCRRRSSAASNARRPAWRDGGPIGCSSRPPRPRLSPQLQAAFTSARPFEVPFAGGVLPAWRWGHGPTVLLVHGWGSRAGHLAAFVARAAWRPASPPWRSTRPRTATRPAGARTCPEIARAMEAVAPGGGAAPRRASPTRPAPRPPPSLSGAAWPRRRVVFLAPAAIPEGFTRTFAAELGLGPASLRAMRARAERRIGAALRRARPACAGRGAARTAAGRARPRRRGDRLARRGGGGGGLAGRGARDHARPRATTACSRTSGVVARASAFLRRPGGSGLRPRRRLHLGRGASSCARRARSSRSLVRPRRPCAHGRAETERTESAPTYFL